VEFAVTVLRLMEEGLMEFFSMGLISRTM